MLRGTRIITGDEAFLQSDVISDLRYYCREIGYKEVIIPSIWEQSTFVEKAGAEVLGQMYTFKDKKERDICLIPEVTAIIQEEYRNTWSKTEKKPYCIFYVSRCYRYERPQAGRYREFLQFGVEVLGDPEYPLDKIIAKAEILVEIASCGTIATQTNTSVKRGLSYYTEDGFEIECPALGAQKQICGGGRYAEGIGFALGVDRIILARTLK